MIVESVKVKESYIGERKNLQKLVGLLLILPNSFMMKP